MDNRAIAFTDLFNFRDLGGYRTLDGRLIRWRRLFRSDDLSRLIAAEQDRFDALGIRTVVDLRRPEEIAEVGRFEPTGPATYYHAHLTHPHWPQRDFADTSERAAYVTARYLEMAEHGTTAIGDALRLIAHADHAPLVFHCAAGKDRTGIVAALTLSLLGVTDDTIADDYTLSEAAEKDLWAYLGRAYPHQISGKQRWVGVTISPREGILGLLDGLRERHGSVEAYADSIGVHDAHVAQMRAHLLTDPAGN